MDDLVSSTYSLRVGTAGAIAIAAVGALPPEGGAANPDDIKMLREQIEGAIKASGMGRGEPRCAVAAVSLGCKVSFFLLGDEF